MCIISLFNPELENERIFRSFQNFCNKWNNKFEFNMTIFVNFFNMRFEKQKFKVDFVGQNRLVPRDCDESKEKAKIF